MAGGGGGGEFCAPEERERLGAVASHSQSSLSVVSQTVSWSAKGGGSRRVLPEAFASTSGLDAFPVRPLPHLLNGGSARSPCRARGLLVSMHGPV